MNERKGSMIISLPSVLTLAAGMVLLALALLSWRGQSWSALVWLAALLAMFAIRTPHARRNSANIVVAGRKDATEAALLGAMFVTMMLLPLLHLATNLFAFADYSVPQWAAWAGTVAQVPFLWLFWRSHADLGQYWSPGLEVREDHRLVTRGIYTRIRHPMYAAIWISALAQPLLIPNWIAGFLVVPAFATMWLLRVPREER